MEKKVMINGVEYLPGYPVCGGCPHLTIGNGWFCSFEPDTLRCAYPDRMAEAIEKHGLPAIEGGGQV